MMEVHFTPELERTLKDMAARRGVPAGDLVQELVLSSLGDLSDVKAMLDSRYDDIKSGRVKPIDGEAFFESLRQREEKLLNRSPK